MNKKYENPLFEVIKLTENDILRTSGEPIVEQNDPQLNVEDQVK